MKATELIRNMIENERVEKVGASGWVHTPEVDRKSAEKFAARIIELTDHSSWDFVKIMFNGVYNQEAHGADIEYMSENIPLENLRTKNIMTFKSYLVNNKDDMKNFPVLDVSTNEVY